MCSPCVNGLKRTRPDHAVIERGQAMPRQGASSGYKYGRSVGALEAVVMLCEIPLTIVEPTAWKKSHGLSGCGGDKEASRQRALQLFPSAHDFLSRKMDHGRAEAALIALTPIQKVSAIAAPPSSIAAAGSVEP
jgi:hypothetical protein